MAAWVEFTLLRRSLNLRVGWTGLDRKFLAQLWGMAFLAATIAFAIKFATPHAGPRLQAMMVIPAFGAIYLGLAYMLDLPEFRGLLRRNHQSAVLGCAHFLMVSEVLLPASIGASATLPP